MTDSQTFIISRKNRGVLKSAQIRVTGRVTGPRAATGTIPGKAGLSRRAQLTAQAGREHRQRANKRENKRYKSFPSSYFKIWPCSEHQITSLGRPRHPSVTATQIKSELLNSLGSFPALPPPIVLQRQ